ncbi:metalloprotease PmbA [Arhodomonas aquaeolei]|uniref:metalloprotease PmbA n=1 Tax=Arhodomonas TaxID=2368 RepID=UPI001969F9B9|nr:MULTISPECIES: metalloprotease PmbA [Arhodomonas]MCS4505013.1 metalloprotease PmbA [Arhodomonas aquaeolei]
MSSERDGNRGLPSVAELKTLVERALETARQRGASAAEVAANASQGLSVKVRQGEVDTLEHMRDRGLAVSVYFGQRKGEASSADYSAGAIDETVAAACEIARYTSEDPCSGLADAGLLARDVPDLGLHHPWGVSAEAAIELARETERAALDVDSRLTNSEGAEVSAGEGVRVYGNSHGFIGGYPASQHAISCAVLGREGDAMQRDFWYTAARAPEWLESAAEVGRQAGRRTVARLGARRLSTRQVPVIFDPSTARGLIGHFVGAISGGSLYRRASFLVDHLDRQVFPAGFSISERPHLPGALGSTPFDGEGVATRDRELVVDGVLRGYVLSSYSARKLGMETTGNAGGVHNLCVAPGEKDLDELVADVGEGLLVTQLMGQGVNTVTGDYSRGASGFWIENGRIAYPVEEITIAGNLKEMLRHITAVGRDVDTRGSIRTGSLVVEGMTVAGE